MTIALLIDADNTQLAKLPAIMDDLCQRGTPSIRRAYGNWSKPQLAAWPETLKRYAIKAEQQFDYATDKNATDMALTVAAMDLLHTTDCDTFAIATSDCDFTPLAIRLREGGKQVIGYGRIQTPEAFSNSCTEFVFLEPLPTAEREQQATTAATSAAPPRPAKNATCPTEEEVHQQLHMLSAQSAERNGYVSTETANAQLRHYALIHGKNFTLARLGSGYSSWRQFFSKHSEQYDFDKATHSYRSRLRIHYWLHCITNASKTEEQFTPVALAGAQLHKLAREEGAEFNIKDYGHKKLIDFLNSFPSLYEVRVDKSNGTNRYRYKSLHAAQRAD